MLQILDVKRTSNDKSYWSKTGAYQKEYDELFEKLVPIEDDAKTVHGELISCASKLYYEYHNNGNCNATKCSYENDDDELTDLSINSRYQGYIDFIEKHLKKNFYNGVGVIYAIENILNQEYTECVIDEQSYNKMIDYIMYYVLNTENEAI